MKNIYAIISVLFLILLAGCSQETKKIYGSPESKVSGDSYSGAYFTGGGVSIAPEVKTPPKGDVHKVRLDITHKEIEIAEGVKVMAWTFGDSIPGPVVHVKEGDKVEFIMTNRTLETAQVSPPMPHSIDFHAAMINPKDKYRTIVPGQTLQFDWYANYPGVFMYHCGTPMILHHMLAGMYGMTIVDPKGGYGTKIDREYAIVQSEFYVQKMSDGHYEMDIESARKKMPSFVTFNGIATQYVKNPLIAKPGERVRLYVLNVGPNDTSSFHVVGTLFDKAWLDGNPANLFRGLQTILLGASNGAVVEFAIPEKGTYIMVDHEFGDVEHGAVGLINTE